MFISSLSKTPSLLKPEIMTERTHENMKNENREVIVSQVKLWVFNIHVHIESRVIYFLSGQVASRQNSDSSWLWVGVTMTQVHISANYHKIMRLGSLRHPSEEKELWPSFGLKTNQRQKRTSFDRKRQILDQNLRQTWDLNKQLTVSISKDPSHCEKHNTTLRKPRLLLLTRLHKIICAVDGLIPMKRQWKRTSSKSCS